MCVLLITRLLRLVGRWARKPVNHSSWLAVVFVALFVLSLCPFDVSAGVGAFVIGLSQISSFFSYSHWILPLFKIGGTKPFWQMSLDISDIIFITTNICVKNFMTSPPRDGC